MPTGCSVPNVPCGTGLPSASSVAESASYSVSAFGLAIENGGSTSPLRKAADGAVRWRTTVSSSTTSQLLYSDVSGASPFGSFAAKPPKITRQ